MRCVELAFFDAGGGHRNAALALQHELERQERPWTVRLLNLQELLDPLDVVKSISGIRLQDAYNHLLKRGWTLGSVHLLRATQFIIRRYHAGAVRLLEDYWRQTRPDLVVSLVPNLNRALRESVRRALGSAPFTTILTDLADYPPHFWIEAERQFFICGTAHAVEQAKAIGHAADHVFLTSGMIVSHRFYEPLPVARAAGRARLGLRADLATGIVLLGGEGSNAILEIARRLDRSGLAVQLILVCGRNDGLAAALRRRPWRIPVHVEGFTREIPSLMHVSDFFIGKPGPGSLSEAWVMGLPVIVERNAWTLPQERFNADVIRERQLGLVIKSFRYIEDAVRTLLSEPTAQRYRANVGRMRNRAVFEIPPLLDTILARASNDPEP